MAINPAIAMGIQPIQLKDPLQSYGQIAAIQNAQNQNALAQYQLGAAQRAEDQASALGKAYAAAVNPDTGDVDQNALIKTLAGGAGAAQIPAALKATIEAQSAKANLQKAQQEGLKLAFERARALVPSIKDQSGYDAWKGFVTKDFPGLAGVLPDQYSPENIRAIALDADKLYEQHFVPQTLGRTTQVLGMNKYGGGQATVVPGSVAQVTMSPAEEAANRVAQGNLAVNQGRLAFDRSVENWKRNNPEMDIKEVDGALVGINKRTGKAAPVVGADGKPLGGEGIGKLTEDQGKAVGFGARMLASSPVIDELESTVSKAMPWVTATGYLNFLATPEGRQYEQAKRNWVTANLRKESGAVIGDDEMYNESVKYFPVTGDDPATIEQKRQARKLSERAMLAVAGPGAKHAQKMANDSITALNKSKNQKPGTTPTQGGVDTSNPLLR